MPGCQSHGVKRIKFIFADKESNETTFRVLILLPQVVLISQIKPMSSSLRLCFAVIIF